MSVSHKIDHFREIFSFIINKTKDSYINLKIYFIYTEYFIFVKLHNNIYKFNTSKCDKNLSHHV